MGILIKKFSAKGGFIALTILIGIFTMSIAITETSVIKSIVSVLATSVTVWMAYLGFKADRKLLRSQE